MVRKSKKIANNGIRDITGFDNVGKVQIALKQIMDERNLSISMVHKRSKTEANTIKRYYAGENQSVDLYVLARLCCALECDISDILCYQLPDKKI